MNTIAAISGNLGLRPSVDGWTMTSARTGAAEEIGIEEMLFKLEQEAVAYKVALRVQEIGTRSQPLSRIDVTDLALMIVSGNAAARVWEAADSNSVFNALPGAYAQGW